MKIKKWLSVAAIATVAGLTLAACGNSDKKADNTTTVKIATVNRSGSEEARWDKVQELVEKVGATLTQPCRVNEEGLRVVKFFR